MGGWVCEDVVVYVELVDVTRLFVLVPHPIHLSRITYPLTVTVNDRYASSSICHDLLT